MSWLEMLKGNPIPWLLEPESPGVRYLTLRFLLDRPDDDQELREARREAHQNGEIGLILSKINVEGYWEQPGAGYNPKYYSTVWSLILLAQLGAVVEEDDRIVRACRYFLEQALAPGGQISGSTTPSGTADCLQGNMCWALTELGYTDPRLEKAYDWMARSVTGEGIAPAEDKKAARRFYAGKCGPLFACGANNRLPCAWGAAKVMLAFSRIPEQYLSPEAKNAIQQGVDFLFSVDPASAAYPAGWTEHPSQNWWKFGFPVFYITDLLQIVEALAGLGYGKDPRLQHSLELILGKQNDEGRWALEYDYTGKTWADFGEKKKPNKWVTFRVLNILKMIKE